MPRYKVVLTVNGKQLFEDETEALSKDMAINMVYEYMYDALKVDAIEIDTAGNTVDTIH